MDFNEFLNQAWNDHATQAEQVAARIPEGLRLIDQDGQIPPMAQLVTHVFGEHLGQWDAGVQTLLQLKLLPFFGAGGESDAAIARSIASLELASGIRADVDDFSHSDQIRAMAVAASALSERGHAARARALFRGALDRAQAGLAANDPANRALAVTGHTLACALEEKASRNAAETELMILAAQTARKFWEIAGTWLQVERAEYRLSQTFLKAGDPSRSHEHARSCLAIAQKNQAPALELFFGYEALALAESALEKLEDSTKTIEAARARFEELADEDKDWCRPTLKKLESLCHALQT